MKNIFCLSVLFFLQCYFVEAQLYTGTGNSLPYRHDYDVEEAKNQALLAARKHAFDQSPFYISIYNSYKTNESLSKGYEGTIDDYKKISNNLINQKAKGIAKVVGEPEYELLGSGRKKYVK